MSVIGKLLIAGGVIFFLTHSLIAVKDSTESFSRDIFGLPIPTAPEWTSYIPHLGGVVNFFYQFFSVHGLIGLTITIISIFLGSLLMKSNESRKQMKLVDGEKRSLQELFTKALREEKELSDKSS